MLLFHSWYTILNEFLGYRKNIIKVKNVSSILLIIITKRANVYGSHSKNVNKYITKKIFYKLIVTLRSIELVIIGNNRKLNNKKYRKYIYNFVFDFYGNFFTWNWEIFCFIKLCQFWTFNNCQLTYKKSLNEFVSVHIFEINLNMFMAYI